MRLRIVLIGLGESCGELVKVLRQRHHQVTYLRRPGAELNVTERGRSSGAGHYANPDGLFRRHTGTVRDADLIIVSSDIPHRAAVVDWVLDQACGVAAHFEVGAGAAGVGLGTAAADGRALPPFDFYLPHELGDGAEQHAIALEQHMLGLTVH